MRRFSDEARTGGSAKFSSGQERYRTDVDPPGPPRHRAHSRENCRPAAFNAERKETKALVLLHRILTQPGTWMETSHELLLHGGLPGCSDSCVPEILTRDNLMVTEALPIGHQTLPKEHQIVLAFAIERDVGLVRVWEGAHTGSFVMQRPPGTPTPAAAKSSTESGCLVMPIVATRTR